MFDGIPIRGLSGPLHNRVGLLRSPFLHNLHHVHRSIDLLENDLINIKVKVHQGCV